jgi:hypothetical protein
VRLAVPRVDAPVCEWCHGPAHLRRIAVHRSVLREDSQREKAGRAVAHAHIELNHAWLNAALDSCSSVSFFAHTDRLRRHQTPPTVLRLQSTSLKLSQATRQAPVVDATDIIVVVIRAIARVRVSSKTVPSQTVSVRPDWST